MGHELQWWKQIRIPVVIIKVWNEIPINLGDLLGVRFTMEFIVIIMESYNPCFNGNFSFINGIPEFLMEI